MRKEEPQSNASGTKPEHSANPPESVNTRTTTRKSERNSNRPTDTHPRPSLISASEIHWVAKANGKVTNVQHSQSESLAEDSEKQNMVAQSAL